MFVQPPKKLLRSLKKKTMSNATATSNLIVDPIVANVMNAAMCGFFAFGLIMTPQQFMLGGKVQESWFNEEAVPKDRNDRLFYVAQFMGLLMLGGVVVPALIDPTAQVLCYQMAIMHGVQLLHTLVFMLTSVYGDAKPIACAGIAQWVFTMLLTAGFFVVSLLAGLHDAPAQADAGGTLISKDSANIAALCFSSIFGLLFVVAPRYLISAFWQDEDQEGGDDFMGFKIVKMEDIDAWWARCVGFSILSLNAGLLVDGNYADPSYTAGTLTVFSVLTLHNMHQVTMRPYKSISDYQLKVSWIPNILMSAGMVAVMICAM